MTIWGSRAEFMTTPAALQYNQYYHIFNRGNNRESIFFEERNYHYFMKLYSKYIVPVAETYAYCLLGNHFHFLVRICSEDEIRERNLIEEGNPKGLQDLSGLVVTTPSMQFGKLFNAYTKAINKAYGRTGSLFQKPFGRVLLKSNAHLLHLIMYIHQNPQKHGLVDDFRDWPYSSYGILFEDRETRLMRDVVMELFGGAEGVEPAHLRGPDLKQIVGLVGDDER
jgi:REP element-mobilizing transposase RayT